MNSTDKVIENGDGGSGFIEASEGVREATNEELPGGISTGPLARLADATSAQAPFAIKALFVKFQGSRNPRNWFQRGPGTRNVLTLRRKRLKGSKNDNAAYRKN